MQHPVAVSYPRDVFPSENPRTIAIWLYALLALVPVGIVGFEVACWIRDIPRWDEFDTTLDLLVALDSGAGLREIFERLVAPHNEHRMVVSRSLFAASYWLCGGIDFAAIAVAGNLCLVGAVALLVTAAETAAARARLAAILTLGIVQLQHHECLFWGGASIDHFFVVLATVGALRAVTLTGRGAVAAGCGCALLATFSLTHGMMVWPVGLALLGAERRWRAAGAWAAVGTLAVGLFFYGFQVNPAHRLPTPHDLPQVGAFWLRLLGSSPALDDVRIAPWLGGVFVAAALWVFRGGWSARERLALGVIAWCLGAMAMVAWGRAMVAPAWMPVSSRYLILSSLAWASLIGVVVERGLARRPQWAGWWLPPALAALFCFNVAANFSHRAEGRELARASELAVRSYHRHGTFAESADSLYPDPARADELMAEAQRRNLYRLPALEELTLPETPPVTLDEPTEIDSAVYFIEEVELRGGEMCVRGWAFPRDRTMRFGELAVVFRSEEGLFAFEAAPRLRPDVAEAHERWDAANGGFELHLPESSLPPGNFEIGVCFSADRDAEYMMTANTVTIPKS